MTMARRYAQDTTVPVERTQAEIAVLLQRHGAKSRLVGTDDETGRAMVAFKLNGVGVRLEVRVPSAAQVAQPEPRGWWNWEDARRERWTLDQQAQIERARWRSMLLRLKASLEAIAEDNGDEAVG